MRDKISSVLRKNFLFLFGFCRFSELGAPLRVRSARFLPENAATVITFLFPYRIPSEEPSNLSLYCIGEDYHTIIMKKLNSAADALAAEFPQNRFAAFCDSSPVREVEAAYKSGLGFLGKNGLIIHPKFGSYCFIGEIVTDLAVENCDSPLGFCIGCLECVRSCPAGALEISGDGPARLNSSLCFSALTQKKGMLSDEETAAVRRGGLVWGCDGCSLVCPMNKDAAFSNIDEFYNSPLYLLREENLDGADERAYGYKGKEILRRNLRILCPKCDNNNEK